MECQQGRDRRFHFRMDAWVNARAPPMADWILPFRPTATKEHDRPLPEPSDTQGRQARVHVLMIRFDAGFALWNPLDSVGDFAPEEIFDVVGLMGEDRLRNGADREPELAMVDPLEEEFDQTLPPGWLDVDLEASRRRVAAMVHKLMNRRAAA